ncbi:hypothetical protein T08_12478 [Trichinella sp. T8]|nr:hypothetical protein T08_12478 [Trichinella sp. T8]
MAQSRLQQKTVKCIYIDNAATVSKNVFRSRNTQSNYESCLIDAQKFRSRQNNLFTIPLTQETDS